MSEKVLVVSLSIIVIGVVLFLSAMAPHGDIDSPGLSSGLIIRTDALTGCQYLSTGYRGGITPRLNAAGKQICGGQK